MSILQPCKLITYQSIMCQVIQSLYNGKSFAQVGLESKQIFIHTHCLLWLILTSIIYWLTIPYTLKIDLFFIHPLTHSPCKTALIFMMQHRSTLKLLLTVVWNEILMMRITEICLKKQAFLTQPYLLEVNVLTHSDLVTPHGDIDLGQHCLK